MPRSLNTLSKIESCPFLSNSSMTLVMSTMIVFSGLIWSPSNKSSLRVSSNILRASFDEPSNSVYMFRTAVPASRPLMPICDRMPKATD